MNEHEYQRIVDETLGRRARENQVDDLLKAKDERIKLLEQTIEVQRTALTELGRAYRHTKAAIEGMLQRLTQEQSCP